MFDVQQFECVPPQCNKKGHNGQPIKSLCLRQKCNESSAQCYYCTFELHKDCVPSTKMKELSFSMEYTLRPVKHYLQNPTNSNQLGRFLKVGTQLNIENIVETVENRAISAFEDCEYRIKFFDSNYEMKEQMNTKKRALNEFIKGLFIVLLWIFLGFILSNQNISLEAYDTYQQEMAQNLKNRDYWFNQGFELFKIMNSIKQSIPINKQSTLIQIMPKFLTIQGLLQLHAAINYYQSAINIDPNYAQAWNNKGIPLNLLLGLHYNSEYYSIISKLNRYQEAIICHQQAINIDPNNFIAWKQCIIQFKLNQLQQAFNCYQQAINIYSNYEDAWNNRGEILHLFLGAILFEQNRYREAINTIRQQSV